MTKRQFENWKLRFFYLITFLEYGTTSWLGIPYYLHHVQSVVETMNAKGHAILLIVTKEYRRVRLLLFSMALGNSVANSVFWSSNVHLHIYVENVCIWNIYFCLQNYVYRPLQTNYNENLPISHSIPSPFKFEKSWQHCFQNVLTSLGTTKENYCRQTIEFL